MDLIPRKQTREGIRGGRGEFKWEDVKNDKYRTNYLGHSVMAPTGRWAQKNDALWYTKDRDNEARRREENSEKDRLKDEEEIAMAGLLGTAPRLKHQHPEQVGGSRRQGREGRERSVSPNNRRIVRDDYSEQRSNKYHDRNNDRPYRPQSNNRHERDDRENRKAQGSQDFDRERSYPRSNHLSPRREERRPDNTDHLHSSRRHLVESEDYPTSLPRGEDRSKQRDHRDQVTRSNQRDQRDQAVRSTQRDQRDQIPRTNQRDQRDQVAGSGERDHRDWITILDQRDQRDQITSSNQRDQRDQRYQRYQRYQRDQRDDVVRSDNRDRQVVRSDQRDQKDQVARLNQRDQRDHVAGSNERDHRDRVTRPDQRDHRDQRYQVTRSDNKDNKGHSFNSHRQSAEDHDYNSNRRPSRDHDGYSKSTSNPRYRKEDSAPIRETRELKRNSSVSSTSVNGDRSERPSTSQSSAEEFIHPSRRRLIS
ncbi:kinase phosphorylation protein-domain-containing protein [Lipomyces japonicus]|uniref:kinase phosphorylation protein-domain-containing protein n=1 Tax=Lipomyces japonicus TaxID=56871 RepID=UPI0034CE53BB